MYHVYAKMLQLNEVCEQFVMRNEQEMLEGRIGEVNASLDNSHVTSVLGSAAEDDMLSFDTLSKKRWLDQRFLMEPGFIEGAPVEL